MNGRNVHLLQAAYLWHEAGWHPIPTTGKDGKTPYLKDTTGYDGVDLDRVQLDQAFSAPGVVGLGLRMPEGVLGIDVDGYDGKLGPEALAALCQELGVELPDGPTTSGRTDGRSGIHFFRVPPGLQWTADAITALGGGVELIHRGHRHAKAWPSTHHVTGLPIGRVDLSADPTVEVETHDADDEPWLLPEPDELPDLPPELVQALTKRLEATSGREAIAWVNDQGMATEWSASVQLAMARWWVRQGSRYEAMRDAQAALVRLDSLGQAGATMALTQLKGEYLSELQGERDAEAEFDRALLGAIDRVSTSDSWRDEARREVAMVFRQWLQPDTARLPSGEVVVIGTNLPASFWAVRPTLTHIRDAAWARLRSPDSVLAAVLARLSAITPPLYRIPAIVGAPSTLSMYVALVGPSGTGKTTSAHVARELLPVPIGLMEKVTEHSLGSGEGLIELYMGDVEEEGDDGKKRKHREQTQVGAIVVLDEGAALAEMGGRKGATMLPTLRTMWTGADVGQANALKENTRKLKPGGYALGLMVGLQPSLAADLLDDTAAGTPQRFLWASTIDPSLPDQRPAWPGPLGHRTPPAPRDGRAVPELHLAPAIVDTIVAAAVAKVRGQVHVDPLDSHRDLLRLKLAGLLAVLDQRLCVSEEDWTLAGVMVDTSTAVREATQEVLRAEAMRREEDMDRKAAKRAKVVKAAEHEQEDTEYRKVLDQAAGCIARKARAKGQVDLREARHAISGRVRKALGSVEEALAHGVALGWLQELPAGGWCAGSVEP